MTIRPSFFAIAAGLLGTVSVSSASCYAGQASDSRAQTSAVAIEPGTSFREVDQPNAIGTKTHLWVYLPTKTTGKIPCVVIGAAGTPLIWGMDLGNGDRPEHLPYVRAGFAVIAYSLEGGVPAQPTGSQVLTGLAQFWKAHAGVMDTQAAIDYALKSVPNIDAGRVYAVGHSSAATLALLASEHDPRIKACVAYAPITDVVQRDAALIPKLKAAVPDIEAFCVETSPITHAERLRCPLLLFHADDDGNVTKEQVTKFRDKVSRTNHHVTYVSVHSGGHYRSMIDEGIPRGLAFLKALP